jgi:hypothetical protein
VVRVGGNALRGAGLNEIIFSGEQHRVHAHLPDAEARVYICFDPWFPSPKMDEVPPFGFKFLSSQGFNVISVKSSRNDWYQSAEMLDVLDVIDRAAGARPRFGYGSSMGAYAAVNFSERLNIGRVLLFGPQYSVHPDKVPWENRWRAEAEKIDTWRHDQIAQAKPVQGIIVHDPYYCPQDRRHVQAILARHPLQEWWIPFGGHQVLDHLAQSKFIRKSVLNLLGEEPDLKPEIARRREARRINGSYWSNVCDHFVQRRNFAGGLHAAQQAMGLNTGDRVLVEHRTAECLYGLGRKDEALALWSDAIGRDQPEWIRRRRKWLAHRTAGGMKWRALPQELGIADFAHAKPATEPATA